jgi:rhodanese-related sulfurtransferase
MKPYRYDSCSTDSANRLGFIFSIEATLMNMAKKYSDECLRQKLFAQFETKIIQSERKRKMSKTFSQMVSEALAQVPTVKPVELQKRLREDKKVLVIDVRDAADIEMTGSVPNAMNISLGSLTYKADNEVPENWREAALKDRSRPIVTTCILGPLGALAGKLLHEMGFTNVSILEGGVQAWKDAGLPTKQVGEA